MEEVIKFITSQDWGAWINNVQALIVAIIAIAMLIPGDQPEKFLQSVLDFIKKFSKK